MIQLPPRSTRTDTLLPYATLFLAHLELNEVDRVNLYLDQPVAFEKYEDNHALGAFILIDRQTNSTVAAGTLEFDLRRAGNIHCQHVDVDKAARPRKTGRASCRARVCQYVSSPAVPVPLQKKHKHPNSPHTPPPH